MRVLVVELNYLGDVLMATPAIRALSRHYDTPIDVLTLPGSGSALFNNPNVGTIWTCGTGHIQIMKELWAMRGYDICINFGTSWVVNASLILTGAEIRAGFAYRNIHFGLTNWMPMQYRVLRSQWRPRELDDLLFSTLGIRHDGFHLEYHIRDDRPIMPGCVVFHVVCRNTRDRRFWLDIHWATLARMLKGERIVFTGLASDREFIQNIIDTVGFGENAAGRYKFDELACLIKHAKLLVTLNTSAMHLGAALDTPTVAIVGGTPAYVVCPIQGNFRAIEDPALASYDPRTGKYPQPRLNEITPAQVLENIHDLI